MLRNFKVALAAGLIALGAASYATSSDAASRSSVVVSTGQNDVWSLQLRPRNVASLRYVEPEKRGLFGKRKSKRERTRSASRGDMHPSLLPTIVSWSGNERPGTLIVDTIKRRLFLVLPNGQARRYGIGVGKPGFEWSGTHKVSMKKQWPDWRPPASMIERERRKGRNLPAFMAGGPKNPLGARALYLGSTIYRIHGTNNPRTIGHAVSSGCIRMRNEDVMDLYERVPVGATVRVI